MNDAKELEQTISGSGKGYGILVSILAASWMLAGCGDHIRQPSEAELARFQMDFPAGPAVDVTEIVQAKLPNGPYRVVPGDVLQLEIPMALDPQPIANGMSQGPAKQAYTCRVGDNGTIVLPVVGGISVAGKTLAAVESTVAAAYFPKYIKTHLPVYASVVEYKTCRVSIVGAVAKPGIYDLRHDQMSLVALLMEAGNIVDDGAALIRISQGLGEDRNQGRPTPAPVRSASRLSWSDGSPDRLVFEPEGPLWTTGWLALEGKGDRPFRQWLDLANEPQRHVFLDAARTQERMARGGDLETPLVHLAGHLESNSRRRDVDSTPIPEGWHLAEGGRFVASLQGQADSEDADGQGAGTQGLREPTSILLPVKGLNVPFADVALTDGASVTVGRPYERSIVIVGLVNRPGLMPYPLDARYTLIEAIAYAGGLNLVADPRHVSVYRLQADGTVRGITVQLVNPKAEQDLTQEMSMLLRPGDVVSVENTMRTRTNVFFDRVFRISLGLYVTPESLWNDN